MLELIVFIFLAVITCIFAILVLFVKEVVHAVVSLALMFISIAGIYILLNAEFIALVQILIYAGAVTVLILFAIMLTRREIILKGGSG
ncbi:MAG: NADH-quinone oxidoreductase subunit J [Candidatus Thermoplasmatota archaeon]